MSDHLPVRVAELEGAQIHYLESGEGKTVVFLHGLGGAPRDATFIPSLAARFRLLVPSQPGFDESSLGQCETVQDIADVMVAFIRYTAEGPVHVVGESFGGWVACWLAVRHPEVVDRLVLAAPAAFRPEAHGSPAALTPEEMTLRLFGRLPPVPPSPKELELRQRNSANGRRFIRSHWDAELFERLPEIQAPTLVLWSTEDTLIPPESGPIYQKRIPLAYLMYIYGGAHSLPIAAATQFVELTTDFLERGEAFVVNQG